MSLHETPERSDLERLPRFRAGLIRGLRRIGARFCVSRRTRRVVLWGGAGLLATAILAASVGAILVWRLQYDDNSAFLREQFLDGLGAGLGPNHTLSLAKAGLQISGLRPTFAVGGLTVENRETGAKATLESAEFTLKPTAFWRLSPEPTAIAFEGLRLTFREGETGEGPFDPTLHAPEALIAAVRAVLVGMHLGMSGSDPPFATLKTIEGKGIEIASLGAAGQVSILRTGVSLRVMREGKSRVSMRLGVADASDSIVLTGEVLPPEDGLRRFEIASQQLRAGAVFALLGRPIAGISPALAIDLRTRSSLDAAGRLVSGQVSLGFRDGRVILPDDDIPPIELTSARIDLALAAGRGDIVVERFDLKFGEAHIIARGLLTPEPEANGGYRLQMDGQTLDLDRVTPAEPLVALDLLKIEGRLSRSFSTFTLDRLNLKAGAGEAQISGRFSVENGGLIETAVEARDFDLRTALRIWPVSVAPPVRRWMVEHALGGRLTSLSLRSHLSGQSLKDAFEKRPIPDEALALAFDIQDAVLRPLKDGPPITGATLRGRLSGRKTAIDLVQGQIETAANRILRINAARVTIQDSARKPTLLELQIPIAGRVDALLALLATPSLKPFLSVPADLKITSGQFEGAANIGIRLVADPKPQDTRVDLTASLRDVAIEEIIKGEKLEGGAFRLISERGQISLKGDAQMLGVPAQIEFKSEKNQPPEARIRLVLDDAQRAKRGFDLRPAVSGPIAAVFLVTLPPGKKPEIDVEIDLARAKVEGIIPGFLKRAGQPGKVSFDIVARGDGTLLDDFEMDLGVVSAKGKIELGRDGQFSKADLSALKLSPGDNARAQIEKTRGGLKINLKGNAFDARPFLKGLQSGKIEDGKAGDLDLDLQTTVLVGFGGELISNADIQAQKRNGLLTKLNAKGRFGPKQLLVQTAEPKPDSVLLLIDSQDAGALVRFADIYSRMHGGRLTADIQINAAGQRGLVQVRDFILRDEPGLRQFATSAAGASRIEGTGQIGGARGPGGEVAFTKLRTDFSRKTGRLDLHEFVMWGQQIGGTLEGAIDYGQDRVDLKGSFVPAYGLNNLFAQVPVFGRLLGGSQYEGLFALPFIINGKASEPVLRTNPISAVAPGFMRKFFELQRAPNTGR